MINCRWATTSTTFFASKTFSSSSPTANASSIARRRRLFPRLQPWFCFVWIIIIKAALLSLKSLYVIITRSWNWTNSTVLGHQEKCWKSSSFYFTKCPKVCSFSIYGDCITGNVEWLKLATKSTRRQNRKTSECYVFLPEKIRRKKRGEILLFSCFDMDEGIPRSKDMRHKVKTNTVHSLLGLRWVEKDL